MSFEELSTCTAIIQQSKKLIRNARSKTLSLSGSVMQRAKPVATGLTHHSVVFYLGTARSDLVRTTFFFVFLSVLPAVQMNLF